MIGFTEDEVRRLAEEYRLDFDEVKEARANFTDDEWIDVVLRSVGMEPSQFDRRVKWLHLARLIPLVENNYNLVELGPRGTGKSHIYKEISPNSILVSGGQTTVANLFYNMGARTIGLVGLWDCVAFDEVAGIKFKDKDGIQIMKDYMASGSFARGKEEKAASASMVFVGNINQSVDVLLKTSSLFDPFPPEMGTDTAFLDRIHCYLPGWEIPKMRPEFFTDNYGFITDYFSECLREMRKRTFSDAIQKYFRLGKDLNQRDVIAIKHTVSGLLKLLYPDGNFGKEEVKECLEYALIGRRRIKEQLKKIGGLEFFDVHFSYIDLEDNEEHFVATPECKSSGLIPEGELQAGCLFCIANQTEGGNKGLVRLDLQKMQGNGKFEHTGFGSGTTIRDELKEAVNYLRSNISRISNDIKFGDYELHLKATDIHGIGTLSGMELAVFISLVSGLCNRPVQPQLCILGSMSIGGTIIGTTDLPGALEIANDAGAKRILIPAIDMMQYGNVPADLMTKFSLEVYTDPIDAAFKAIGVK